MAVVFDCSSSMAMFRKPYTTTSSVSFAFPPPSAVAGLLSAIIGLENGASENGARADYWSALRGTRIALSILNATRWLRATLNFWDTGEVMNAHTQVKHQFVASPKYRIYVEGGIEEYLDKYLRKGSFFYTPYLGTAYSIAQIDYVGACQPQPVEEDAIQVDSILPWEENGEGEMPTLDIAKTGGVFRELVPFALTPERGLVQSINVVFSVDAAHPIYVKKRGALNVTRCVVGDVEKVIAWFPEWGAGEPSGEKTV